MGCGVRALPAGILGIAVSLHFVFHWRICSITNTLKNNQRTLLCGPVGVCTCY